jgi:hypothetical protein
MPEAAETVIAAFHDVTLADAHCMARMTRHREPALDRARNILPRLLACPP